ncbi:unnamed protein product [Paramecium pentaurelia]|uniref:C2 NT-type domain-containing protein n=1 Tax=Paramecium pentaurelia TaxID=43138 RepID=A0A8S1UV45_9CILI|nr:unnamed protein product [Paramecium pentaurelia]
MNRNGYRFQVEATILNVQLLVHIPCKIQVVIKYGSQKLETRSHYELQKGIAIINETLQFNINANLNQDGNLEEKKAQLIVILVTEKGMKNAGFHSLDFAQYLNQSNTQYQETLALDKCPDKKAKLLINFKITKIGEFEKDETKDHFIDLTQVSVSPSGLESHTNQNSKDASEQILLLSDNKIDESGSKQQKQENQLINNKDIQINEQNLQIQQLKSKINDMIEKQIHENMINKYEQQLQDQENKYKLIQNNNEQINLQLENQQQNLENEQSKQSMVQQIQNFNIEIQTLYKQISDKNQQISELNQKIEILENQQSKQIGFGQTLININQQPGEEIINETGKLIEELQSTLRHKQQDYETLQQKYEIELQKKDELIQNLQLRLDEVELKEINITRSSYVSQTQIIQSEKLIYDTNIKPKQEQQINRLKNQIQIWQSKYESSHKELSDFNNQIQHLQRSIEDVQIFLEDQEDLVEPLFLLRRAIQEKLQNHQLIEQHLEQRVQKLEQELEVCQYQMKLEESQQCSDQTFEPQMHMFIDEVSHLNKALQQKVEQLKILQQQVDQYKLKDLEQQKQSEEAKVQLASLRTNFAKVKQQLAETMQEKVILQAKNAEQQKALKEKNQEIQKEQELIAELEQFNIQMEEALSQTLDQYKIQNTQMKQAYEKEKKLRSELQQQIKSLKEDQTKNLKNEQPKIEEKQQQQCNCKDKIQFYEQKIAELEFQLSDFQIQKLDKTIQRNSIAQIRTSILINHRESLAIQQLEEATNQLNLINSNQGNEKLKPKELEDQNINLTDDRFKMSKEYQTILEKALQTNTQIENKYKNQVKELEEKIEKQTQCLVRMKLQIADLYSAAIEIGGALLVDKLHIALGIRE